MKCFTHPGADAVAVCRHCGRAVCHDCAADVGVLVACKGRCEEDVRLLDGVLTFNGRTTLAILPIVALIRKAAVVLIGLGIGMLILGIVAACLRLEKDPMDAAGIGVLCLAVGFLAYALFRRIDQPQVTRK